MISVKHSVNKKELMYMGHVHVSIFLMQSSFLQELNSFHQTRKKAFNYTCVYHIYVTP